MNKAFKYTTEITLAYGVLEPLHFSCKGFVNKCAVSILEALDHALYITLRHRQDGTIAK